MRSTVSKDSGVRRIALIITPCATPRDTWARTWGGGIRVLAPDSRALQLLWWRRLAVRLQARPGACLGQEHLLLVRRHLAIRDTALCGAPPPSPLLGWRHFVCGTRSTCDCAQLRGRRSHKYKNLPSDPRQHHSSFLFASENFIGHVHKAITRRPRIAYSRNVNVSQSTCA